MGSEDLLVMAMALPPMCMAAKLWWSMRDGADEMRDFRVHLPGTVETVANPDGARRCSGSSG